MARLNSPNQDRNARFFARRGLSGTSAHLIEAFEPRRLLSATFSPAIQINTEPVPRTTAVADFNGDGLPDIATVIPEQNEVLVLMNNGNGTFRRVQRLSDVAPRTIAVGDFNNDGHMDLAVFGPDLTTGNAVIRIFDGRGNGTFVPSPKQTHLVTGGPRLLSVDLNGDGRTDLVATTNGRIAVLINNGLGGFDKPVYYKIGLQSPTDVAVGDFNHDGVPDMAVTRGRLGQVAIFLGNPGAPGTFAPPAFYNTGGNPSGITLGDFNGDGKLDVAVSNEQFRGSAMAILFGNGDGTLRPASLYAGSNFSDCIISGDFSGSGHDDIIVGAFDGALNLYTNDGAGNFAPPTQIQNGQFTQYISVADFNGDGRPDLLLTPYKSLRILLNTSTPVQTPTVERSGRALATALPAASGRTRSFYTVEGTKATVSISGPGRIALSFSSSQPVRIPQGVTSTVVTGRVLDAVSISGSTAATQVAMRVQGGSLTINANTISADSVIGAVYAPRVNVSTVSLPGGVASLQLLSVNGGSITIGGSVPTTVSIGQIGGETASFASAIRTLNVAQDVASTSITAPSIGQMIIGGLLGSNVTLTATRSPDLLLLIATRGLFSSVIRSATGIGTVSAANMTGSQLFAGVGALQNGESLPSSASEFSSAATIRSVSLLADDRIPSFGNSAIAAINIRSLHLARVQTNNGGVPFGVTAHFINDMSGFALTSRKAFDIRRINSTSVVSSALAKRRIDFQDLAVRIV